MKKKLFTLLLRGNSLLSWRMFRTMQLTLLLALACILQLSAAAFPQEFKLSVSLQSAKVSTLFNFIQQRTDYQFLYNDEDVQQTPAITVSMKDATIPQILDASFKGTALRYRITNKTVVVFSASQAVQPVQERTISGTVKDIEGKPLPGVTVAIGNTATGTTTNDKGFFSLKLPEGALTLVFTSIGFIRQELPIAGRSVVNVTMQSNISSLDNVVVVGYGTRKQATVTGSISTVKGTELRQSPSANLSNSLAGRMTGIIANNRSGEPGNDYSDILIRGKGTLNDNSPLIVIDGVANRGAFERLNADDIESITVLKDASAAIYGAQAANGVILVTTKRGKTGKPVISYSASYGLTQPTRLPKLVNAAEYATYINELNERKGVPKQYTDDDIKKYADGSNPITHPNTDWYHAVLKDLSPQTRHALSLSGGNDKVSYFLSGEYLYQDGLYRNSATKYHQYNLRSNIDANITSNLKVGLDLSGRLEDRKYSNYGSNSIFAEVLSAYPTLPDYYPNGMPGPGLAGGRNPVLMASGATGYNKIRDYFIQTALTFEWKLPFITNGLSVSGLLANDFQFNAGKSLYDNWDAFQYDPGTKEYINMISNEGPISINQNFRNYKTNTFNLRLNYARRFDKHDISGFVAYEQSAANNEGINAYRKDLLSNKIDQLFIGDDMGKDNGSSAGQSARRNVFGRASYAYDNKYLAEVILRYDGSYIFPAGRRWGLFPGVSVGWRLSEEPFFRELIPAATQFKLKASWGKLGNDKVDPYQFLQQYRLDGGYYLGPNSSHVRGLSAGVTPNPFITWEVADNRNAGIETSWWNGLLNVNFDVFKSIRSNILITRNASIPSSTGLDGLLPPENIGKVNNSGFEVEISHQRKVNQHLSYNIGVNYTYTRNNVVFRDEAEGTPDWQKIQGHPMDSWLIFKTDGIYHNQQEIDNTVHLPNAKPGDIRFVDVDGDKKITDNDMVRIYSSPTPQVLYGITMGVNYRGIGLNVLWQGQSNAEQLIMPSRNGGSLTPPHWMYDNRWTPGNPNASFPAAFDRNDNVNNRKSDFFLKNAAFLRLKTVELSYVLPQSLIARLNLQQVRVYVNGFNLLVFSQIKDYDPELNGVTPKSDYPNIRAAGGSYYPQTRIFNAGINISL
ncbi:MAG TPA: TonB-dependent receptor [Chitinophaga sp.]|uniref:TonB-dependent receptor n=1 Tax=Chitinophaga sp. TaxID=1869181 RepID=UPI002C466457|nr:TonB-dependent receptor [Chitinophaga sp.]HVI46362.1 TonB-dependent receptor [Chitinophaga sp.]